MLSSKQSEIIFIHVKSNSAKLSTICKIVDEQFRLGKHVLITVASPQAAQYIDHLIWKTAEESFLPHVIENQESKQAIVITTSIQNINHADILLNLCPQASPIFDQFEKVYELQDETDAVKADQSAKKIAAYQAFGKTVTQRE